MTEHKDLNICKNCGNEFSGNFCNICGQSAHTHEISVHYIWHDIQHGFFHFEKGILYTLKELFTRPGDAVKEFMDGKRINHFRPLSLLILLGGLYAFLLHTFHIDLIPFSRSISEEQSKFNLNIWFNLIEDHFSIAQIVFLPIFSFASYLAFKKYKIIYAKHIILNAFMLSQRLVVRILFLPFLYFFEGTDKFSIFFAISNLLGFAAMIWTMIQFFKAESVLKTVLRSILYFILFFFQMILIGLPIVIILVKFFK